MSKRAAAKGVLMWLVRPGYSKHAYNPVKAFNFRRDIMFNTKAMLTRIAEDEKAVTKDRQDIQKETSKLSDEEAFQYWANYFGHTEDTLIINEKTLKYRRYIYYAVAVLSLALLIFTLPVSGFIDAISSILLVVMFLLNIFQGAKDAWSYHQVKQRSMFHFLTMFEKPLKFLV